MASVSYPVPPDDIPLVNQNDYMKGDIISSSGYGVYKVLNHPDKLLKIMKLFDAPEDAMHEENPWTELKMSYIAGELGIGAKIYGYYVENRNIHMIMELVEGTLLKNTTSNESIYNKVLEISETLVDNGIKNNDMNGSNIIIQNDGSIKVIDYGEAYEISNLSDSKKNKLIIKMARYAKPHDDSEMSLTDEISKRLATKLSLLNEGKKKKRSNRARIEDRAEILPRELRRTGGGALKRTKKRVYGKNKTKKPKKPKKPEKKSKTKKRSLLRKLFL